MGCSTVSDYTVQGNDLSKTPIIHLGSKKKSVPSWKSAYKISIFFPDVGDGVETFEDNFSGGLM